MWVDCQVQMRIRICLMLENPPWICSTASTSSLLWQEDTHWEESGKRSGGPDRRSRAKWSVNGELATSAGGGGHRVMGGTENSSYVGNGHANGSHAEEKVVSEADAARLHELRELLGKAEGDPLRVVGVGAGAWGSVFLAMLQHTYGSFRDSIHVSSVILSISTFLYSPDHFRSRVMHFHQVPGILPMDSFFPLMRRHHLSL